MQTIKKEVRNRILKSAVTNFLNVGYQSASTRNIVSDAKISKGNFYNYFKSKEELLTVTISPLYESLNNLIEQTLDHEDSEIFDPFNWNTFCITLSEMLFNYRNQFIILISKSDGSKYENYRELLIEKLAEHFLKWVNKANDRSKLKLLMKIAATNIVNALLEIVETFEDKESALMNIELFMNYHFNGIRQFY